MLNRKKFREAYETIEPTYEQKERMLDNILSSQAAPTGGKDVTMKHMKKKTIGILIAAAVSLLLVGCAAVLMQLDDLKIGEYSYTQPAWINADGERIEETEITKNVISLQGIAGSNSQLAAQEWYDFTQSYDVDRKILNASDAFKASSAYNAYHVYSQEMVDKVDEIAEKYGLKLAGQQALVQDWSKDIFFEALDLKTLFVENAKAEMGFGAGYFYECGNFKMEFECKVSDPEFQWKNPLFFSLNYKDKGYLDTVFMHLNEGSVHQQTIKLTNGMEVLMVLVKDSQNGDSVHVFCDREDAFVSLRIDINYFNDDGTVEVMRQEDIQRAINLIDFSVKPQKPDMAEAVKLLEAADQAYQEEMEAKMAAMGDPCHKDSYRELAEGLNMKTYKLTDLNGDGIEECLLKGDYDNSALYTMKDGKTEYLLDGGGVLYLCGDNVVERYEVIGDEYYRMHSYYKMEGDGIVQMERIVYDRANDQWGRSLDKDHVCEESLTKEQAESIIGSHVRIDVEMKPISELQ